MKTIEELEAELETVTRERDLSLSAWESAGMQGRTAQSAMLELTRQLEDAQADVAAAKTALDDVGWLEDERDKARAWAHQSERERDESRDTIVALTTAMAEKDLEIATLTAALDERDLEAERSLEQYDRLTRERDEARAESAKWKAGFEEFRSRNTDLMVHLFEAQEKVRAVNIEPMLHLNAQLRSKVHGLSAEVERLVHQLADATNESTHFQVMCKRETEEVERLTRQVELLTDERDELLVRVANQDAELRATREAYRAVYRRGAEAMREACASEVEHNMTRGLMTAADVTNVIRTIRNAIPIPEEP